jgi:hypothetical protein
MPGFFSLSSVCKINHRLILPKGSPRLPHSPLSAPSRGHLLPRARGHATERPQVASVACKGPRGPYSGGQPWAILKPSVPVRPASSFKLGGLKPHQRSASSQKAAARHGLRPLPWWPPPCQRLTPVTHRPPAARPEGGQRGAHRRRPPRGRPCGSARARLHLLLERPFYV